MTHFISNREIYEHVICARVHRAQRQVVVGASPNWYTPLSPGFSNLTQRAQSYGARILFGFEESVPQLLRNFQFITLVDEEARIQFKEIVERDIHPQTTYPIVLVV